MTEHQLSPTSAPAAARPASWLKYIEESLASAVVLLGLIGVLAWQSGWFGGSSAHHAEETAAVIEEPQIPTEVHLSDEKLQAAQLQVVPAEMRRVRAQRVVPGHLAYDAGKHLALTAPVDVVVKQVLVEPGQSVRAGTPLIVLASSEVGLARDEVLKREADFTLAHKQHVWAETIAGNVQQLLKLLKSHPPLADVEREFTDKPLADYREQLVGAYSKLLFAERLLSNSDDLAIQGALSKRVIEERQSNREIAEATFSGACETAKFESTVQHEKLHALEEQATRLLALSRENLASLLGPQGGLLEAGTPEALSTAGNTDKSLAEFVLKAPFDCRIEERQAVVAGRVKTAGLLFVLADTSRLWVQAEIHERDWKVLEHANRGPIQIRVPALGDRGFTTTVRYIGAQVSTDSHSVPLVTEIENPDGLLKPGMFVWVEVPLETERETLVVPGEAVLRHENHDFVFVPEAADRFRRVDVKAGSESAVGVEILSGLKAGQQVVAHGAFVLKSELLLEREAE